MLFLDPETWVAIAFILLVIGFAWMGVHRTVLTALDHRAERIKAELDDASRLKDEAAKVLAEYKARRASAEREAADIIASANAAVEAASTILSQSVKGSVADDLVNKGIAEVRAKLN